MAKRRYIPKPITRGKKEELKYPSTFGSHQVMVDEELSEKINDEKMVVCKDDHGSYVTFKNRLNNGMSDNYRNTSEEFRKKQLVKFGVSNESTESSK